MMFRSDPFLYRSLRPGRQLYRQLLIALIGPLLLELPQLMTHFVSKSRVGDTQNLGLIAFVTFLCIRCLAGSVGAISQERERGSWEVLLSSGFRSRSIMFGLWRACLLPRLLDVSLSLPWLLARVDHPLQSFALLLTLATFYTTLGLFASLRCGSGLKAMQMAYGWLGLTGVGSFLLWIIGQIDSVFRSTWSQKVLLLNPWVAALDLEPGFCRGGAVIHGILTLLLLGLMSRQTLEAPRAVALRGSRRRDQENPLRYRNQFHSQLAHWGLGLLYCLVIVGLMMGWKHGDTDARAAVAVLAHLGFWLVRATYSSCHCLCREREQGSLDALLTTRLKPMEILSGLLSQTLVPLSRQALVLSPLLILAAGCHPGRWLLLVALTQVSLWGWGFAAIAASLYFRTTMKAFQATYLALAFVTVGTLTLDITLLDPLFDLNRPLLCMVNPLLTGLYLALNEKSNSGYWWPASVAATFGVHLFLIWWGRRFALTRLGQPA